MSGVLSQRILITAWATVVVIGGSIVQAAAPATLIITNAKVWTGDKKTPEAQAVAIRSDRIIAVGDNETALAHRTDATRIIDAQGRRVVPGLTDSHTHLISFGLQLTRLGLRDAASKQEFISRVNAGAAGMEPGKWLLGGRYSVESWDVPESPRKEWIDPVTPHVPVFLTRMDGHQALANSVALKFAGIDRGGPDDPPGGVIERDPQTGEPTGILKDAAMSLVSRHIPAPTRRQMYDALIGATRALNAWGITSAHDMSEPEHIEIFDAARERNTLTLRVRSYIQTTQYADTWRTIDAMHLTADDWFEVAGIKAYMDGSLGSRTAYMRNPYFDAQPGDKYPRGLRSAQAADLDRFRRDLSWANERGLQIAVHAIGDQAVHEVLDIYESLPGVRQHRHRVEHAQHLLPRDIARFAQLGVIASMQPLHKADDGRYAENVLGPRRSLTSYAFRSLLDAGACVCFGSDVPVVTANPFAGIAAAISAKTLDGKVWVPQQSINRTEALYAYTVAPQWAAFREDRLGVIAPNYLADLVILDRDVLVAGVDDLPGIESFMTIAGGKVVYRAGHHKP